MSDTTVMFYSTVTEQTHTLKEGQKKKEKKQVTKWWRGRKKIHVFLTFASDDVSSVSSAYETVNLRFTSKEWNSLQKNIPNFADFIIHA